MSSEGTSWKSRLGGMDRRVLIGGGVGAALLVVLGLLWGLRGDSAAVDALVEPVEAADVASPETRPFELYFPAADGRLHAERRELAPSTEPAANVARLVEALIAGPNDAERQWTPLPEGVTLGRAYLMDDATVVLDLASPDGTRPDTGSQSEMLMLYSLVNTVLLNVEEAERLIVLWNGQQPSTFAGHLDTTRPLTPNVDLISPGSRSRGSDGSSEPPSSDT